jgi:predicted Fe-S protein YdhL (DUF1289 family)
VSVCALDADDVCTGCYRTVDEITRWQGLDDESRRAVLVATRERMRAAGVLFE